MNLLCQDIVTTLTPLSIVLHRKPMMIGNKQNGGATSGTCSCNSLIFHDMKCHFLHCVFILSI